MIIEPNPERLEDFNDDEFDIVDISDIEWSFVELLLILLLLLDPENNISPILICQL